MYRITALGFHLGILSSYFLVSYYVIVMILHSLYITLIDIKIPRRSGGLVLKESLLD